MISLFMSYCYNAWSYGNISGFEQIRKISVIFALLYEYHIPIPWTH